MGTKVAPSFANTFMGWFEDQFVYTYHTKPLLWKRYIDDIFMIWQHGTEKLNTFLEHLNNCVPSIKFEMCQSNKEINFLDVMVRLEPDNSLSTTLYTKDTDAHNYLKFNTCHPNNCITSIPYSQFLRLKRICSKEADFVEECRTLATYFAKADYPLDIIQSAFAKVFILNRDDLLKDKSIIPNTEVQDETILVTTFHPRGYLISKIVTRNWELFRQGRPH